jgi:flavin reductase (DIM6/NTAB) family NADH-FMN oxidoreductase RutF
MTTEGLIPQQKVGRSIRMEHSTQVNRLEHPRVVPGQAELRRVFGAFPTGVTAVAALADGSPLGIAASSFTSVSLDPPVVSVCTAHSSTTWPRLRRVPKVGISVLGAHQEDACRQLSARSADARSADGQGADAREANKFATLRWRATDGGAVFMEGASAWLECSVYREVTVGDHDIVLLLVHELDSDPSVAPLVFHASRFRRLSHEP